MPTVLSEILLLETGGGGHFRELSKQQQNQSALFCFQKCLPLTEIKVWIRTTIFILYFYVFILGLLLFFGPNTFRKLPTSCIINLWSCIPMRPLVHPPQCSSLPKNLMYVYIYFVRLIAHPFLHSRTQGRWEQSSCATVPILYGSLWWF